MTKILTIIVSILILAATAHAMSTSEMILHFWGVASVTEGTVYVTDQDGAYLTDQDGAYIKLL